MRSHLANPEPRTCPVCKEEFIPLRRNQMFCSPPKRCRYTNQARILKRQHAASSSGEQQTDHGPSQHSTYQPRPCTKCGREYAPKRPDQKTCGASCPGKPDYSLTCASPACGKEFTVKGNSRGKGSQRYCSEKCRDRESQWRLRERFRRYDGMTPEEFARRVRTQEGKCKICGKEPVPDPRPKREGALALEVDHDHATGATRDLLCGDCNKGLGMFHDNPTALRAAADYLEHHQKSKTPGCAPGRCCFC